jgi:hypothetical protein
VIVVMAFEAGGWLAALESVQDWEKIGREWENTYKPY